MKRDFLCLCGLMACLMASSAFGAFVAQTETLSFYALTNNKVGNPQIAVDQISVDVSSTENLNEVVFTFNNIGLVNCSIAEIYFDDGVLLAGATIIENPPYVDFTYFGDVRPPDLSGGENAVPPFEAYRLFSIGSENPAPHKGINPGETLSLIYTLQSEKIYDNVIDDLTTGALRIGMHVISINGPNGDSSESIVNNAIPEPATMLILAAGGFYIIKKRKKR